MAALRALGLQDSLRICQQTKAMGTLLNQSGIPVWQEVSRPIRRTARSTTGCSHEAERLFRRWRDRGSRHRDLFPGGFGSEPARIPPGRRSILVRGCLAESPPSRPLCPRQGPRTGPPSWDAAARGPATPGAMCSIPGPRWWPLPISTRRTWNFSPEGSAFRDTGITGRCWPGRRWTSSRLSFR